MTDSQRTYLKSKLYVDDVCIKNVRDDPRT